MKRAVTLAAVAGFVDAVGFLTLHTLFTAHMSGNTAELGVRLGAGDLHAAVPLALAVGLFVFGIVLGLLVRELAARRGMRTPGAPVLCVEVALLLAYMLYGATVVRHGTIGGTGLGFYLLVILAVLSMGMQTAGLQSVGRHRVRTTYVSGTLTRLAQGIVGYLVGPRHRSREARRRAALSASVWGLYLAGATLGGFADRRWELWSLGIPLGLLAAVIASELVSELTVAD